MDAEFAMTNEVLKAQRERPDSSDRDTPQTRSLGSIAHVLPAYFGEPGMDATRDGRVDSELDEGGTLPPDEDSEEIRVPKGFPPSAADEWK